MVNARLKTRNIANEEKKERKGSEDCSLMEK